MELGNLILVNYTYNGVTITGVPVKPVGEKKAGWLMTHGVAQKVVSLSKVARQGRVREIPFSEKIDYKTTLLYK